MGNNAYPLLNSGIYKITNIVNNKCYIGKSKNIVKRFESHFKCCKVNKHFKRAIKKYGKENFKLDILEYVNIINEGYNNKMNILEKKYIKKYKSYNPEFGYNKTFGGDGGFHTKETKEKISKSLTGRKLSRKHILNSAKGHVGLKRKEETKIKMSKAQKIAQNRPNVKKKQYEIKNSKEYREKMSESLKGRRSPMKGKKLSEDHKRKISQKLKGRIISDENCKKISERMKNRVVSKKTCEKVSKKMKNRIWIFNINTLETKFINKDIPLPDGWKCGRGKLIRGFKNE